MKKLSNFLWGSLGVLLFALLVFVIIMFSTGRWNLKNTFSNLLDKIFGYEPYEKEINIDEEFYDNSIKDLINNVEIKELSEFTPLDLNKACFNQTPFRNFNNSSLMAFIDYYYSIYRFTYKSDYAVENNLGLTDAYIIIYSGQPNANFKTQHNEILAFGIGLNDAGTSNYFGSNSIHGVEIVTQSGKISDFNTSSIYRFKGYNVFDILKSYALATQDIQKLKDNGITTSQGYCYGKLPFIFGNDEELYKINAGYLYVGKGASVDHYMRYGYNKNNLTMVGDMVAYKIHYDINFKSQTATNILLFDNSDINNFKLIKNGNCSIFNKGV